eukprot:m.24021 g.24021  ORF g.24021 m.24021 type:complete len:597 (+) comp7566_c0_seq1:360-2150(+)
MFSAMDDSINKTNRNDTKGSLASICPCCGHDLSVPIEKQHKISKELLRFLGPMGADIESPIIAGRALAKIGIYELQELANLTESEKDELLDVCKDEGLRLGDRVRLRIMRPQDYATFLSNERCTRELDNTTHQDEDEASFNSSLLSQGQSPDPIKILRMEEPQTSPNLSPSTSTPRIHIPVADELPRTKSQRELQFTASSFSIRSSPSRDDLAQDNSFVIHRTPSRRSLFETDSFVIHRTPSRKELSQEDSVIIQPLTDHSGWLGGSQQKRFYTWQLARGTENYITILERRREMLRESDLANNASLRAEWNDLILELDSAVTEGATRIGRGRGDRLPSRARSRSMPSQPGSFGLTPPKFEEEEKTVVKADVGRINYLDLALMPFSALMLSSRKVVDVRPGKESRPFWFYRRTPPKEPPVIPMWHEYDQSEAALLRAGKMIVLRNFSTEPLGARFHRLPGKMGVRVKGISQGQLRTSGVSSGSVVFRIQNAICLDWTVKEVEQAMAAGDGKLGVVFVRRKVVDNLKRNNESAIAAEKKRKASMRKGWWQRRGSLSFRESSSPPPLDAIESQDSNTPGSPFLGDNDKTGRDDDEACPF